MEVADLEEEKKRTINITIPFSVRQKASIPVSFRSSFICAEYTLIFAENNQWRYYESNYERGDNQE